MKHAPQPTLQDIENRLAEKADYISVAQQVWGDVLTPEVITMTPERRWRPTSEHTHHPQGLRRPLERTLAHTPGATPASEGPMNDPIRTLTPKLLLDVGYRYRSVPTIPSEDLAPVIAELRGFGLDVPAMNADAYAERFIRRVEAGLKTLEAGKARSFKLVTHVSCWVPTPFQTRGHRKPWYVRDRPDPAKRRRIASTSSGGSAGSGTWSLPRPSHRLAIGSAGAWNVVGCSSAPNASGTVRSAASGAPVAAVSMRTA